MEDRRTYEQDSFLAKHGFAIAAILVSAVILLIYARAFRAPFLFDDFDNILLNGNIDKFSNFWPPFKTFGTRYVAFITFAINYRLGGSGVLGYHLLNTAVHIVNSLLVYSLVTLTFKTPLLRALGFKDDDPAPVYMAIIAALIFAAHPVQTEAVTYIVQRIASLAAMFYLLSAVLFIRWRIGRAEKKAHLPVYAFSLAAGLIAQATKEISITLPAIIILYDLVFFNDIKGLRRRLPYLLPYLLLLAVIPAFIISFASGHGVEKKIGQMVGAQMSPYGYLINQFRVIITYMRLLVLPVNQNLDYDYPVFHSIFDPQVLLSFIALLAMLAFTIYVFMRSYRRNGYLVVACFGVFWFFITLSVESSVIPIKDLIFEHRLYLPMAGAGMTFTSAVFYGFERARERYGLKTSLRKAAIVIGLLTVIPLGALTYSRNLLWNDPVAFWKDAAEKSPNKPRVHVNLGYAYGKDGELRDAVPEFQKALQLDPDYEKARLYLGSAYMSMGEMGLAEREFMETIRRHPESVNAVNNLGYLYFKMGRYDDAVRQFRESISLDPDKAVGYYNLGVTYEKLGVKDEAIDNYEKFLARASHYYQSRINDARVALSQLRGR